MTTHRTARERLLFEAKDLPRDVLRLDGIRGHSATVELSDHGPSRIVRVFHEGVEVCWTFAVDAAEPRPQFYPDDVPLVGSLSATVTWDDETGLHVTWMPATEDQAAAFKRRFEAVDRGALQKALADRAQERRDTTAEGRREPSGDVADGAPSPSAAFLKQALLDEDLSAEAEGAIEEIVAFHERAGWKVAPDGPAQGPKQHFTMHRGSAERALSVFSALGIATIGLSQTPGAAAAI